MIAKVHPAPAAILPAGFEKLELRYALRLCRRWLDRALHHYLPLAFNAAEWTTYADDFLSIPPMNPDVDLFDVSVRVAELHAAAAGELAGRRHPDAPDFIDDEQATLCYAALRALNVTTTDVALLREFHRAKRADDIVEAARAVGSLGFEPVMAAAEIVSPAIVHHEAGLRDREVRDVVFIPDILEFRPKPRRPFFHDVNDARALNRRVWTLSDEEASRLAARWVDLAVRIYLPRALRRFGPNLDEIKRLSAAPLDGDLHEVEQILQPKSVFEQRPLPFLQYAIHMWSARKAAKERVIDAARMLQQAASDADGETGASSYLEAIATMRRDLGLD